ncbi:MAG TPA: tetratricopeptide repeat protein [Phycisphaerae bacterium]|nr:tetratricopeptide repeat protein [Phycisphaerae bacterium]
MGSKRARRKAARHEWARAMVKTEPAGPPRIILIVLMLLVAGAVLATHWPALSARAMSCDDQQYLADNLLVRNPSWASARRALTEVLEPSTVAGYYQPLSMISLMIDAATGGSVDNLRPFHRTSLILHVANTLLIVLLLYTLFGRPWPAAVAGLLFGLHPLTVEPIPWVGERKTLLAAFFALAALVAYVRYTQTRRWAYFAGAIIGYALALLSKPTSTPLPLAMLLLDYWPLNRWGRRALWEKAPLLAIGAISAVITFVSQDRTAATVLPTDVPWFYAPLRLFHNVVFYLEKMIWPRHLSSHYPVPDPFNLSDRGLFVGLIGILILVPLAWVTLRYTRALAVGLLIYLVLLLPTVQIIGFSDAIAADKYAYLPAVGILIALAWLLGRWRVFSPARRRGALVIGVEALLIVAASAEVLATRRYLAVWKDTESLCGHMLTLTPKAASVRNHLGLYLAGQGRWNEAVAQYKQALKDNPNHVEARNNLGNAYSELGRHAEAYSCWNRTLEQDPSNFTATYNLGTWYAEQSQLPEARQYLESAVRLRPGHPQARTNLAAILIQMGEPSEAAAHLRESIALWPNSANAHYQLGEALRQTGQFEDAAREFREALRLNPAHQGAQAGLRAPVPSGGT